MAAARVAARRIQKDSQAGPTTACESVRSFARCWQGRPLRLLVKPGPLARAPVTQGIL